MFIFSGMTCVFVVCFFFGGSAEKAKKNLKKKQKKHTNSLEKMKVRTPDGRLPGERPGWTDGSRASGPANFSRQFLSPTSLPRESPCQERKCEKKVAVCTENRNNYCCRYAIVTVVTLQLLNPHKPIFHSTHWHLDILMLVDR